MEIQYLQILKNSPTIRIPGEISVDPANTLQQLPMADIEHIESLYNNGHPFPLALRELLFLARRHCYVLDYGFSENQEMLQIEAREQMTEYGRNKSISRPFYIIDVYNFGDQFLFVYLDEGADPIVYEALLYDNVDDPGEWILSLGKKLSEYIEIGVVKLKSGYNPF